MAYKLPNEALEDNTIKVGKLDTAVTNAFVPVGGIIMWNGSIAEAEALTNWRICDGSNGTPDLRDKFVLGVGSSANASTATKGEEGGNNTITLSEGQMPAHNHNITDNGHNHGDGTLALGASGNTSVTVDAKSFSIDAAGDASNITLATDDGVYHLIPNPLNIDFNTPDAQNNI